MGPQFQKRMSLYRVKRVVSDELFGERVRRGAHQNVRT